MKRFLLPALAIAGLLTFATNSHAALINSVDVSGGNINYNADQGPIEFLQSGDFLTLYDAGESPINLTGDLANSSLFSISTNLTDTPAAGILLPMPDDPTIANLRFTYIGVGNLTDMNLGTFSLVDPTGTFRFVAEDGSSHIPAGHFAEGGIEVAPTLSAVPEPSTFALLGTGLLGLAGAARRKLSR